MSGKTNDLPSCPSWTALSRALSLFSLEAVSLSLGASFLAAGPELHSILEKNQWSTKARDGALLSLALALTLAVLLTLVGGRRAGPQKLLEWARRGAPLIFIGTLPVLLETKFWFQHPLAYLILLGAMGLITEACLRLFLEESQPLSVGLKLPSTLEKLRRSTRAPLWVVCSISFVYVVGTSYLTILDHHRFGTGAYDLGIFDNLMWNTLHGRFFHSSIMYGDGVGNSLAGHAEFGMLLFAPIYALYPSAEMMLCIQSGALGGAAILLYLFASTQVSRWAAAAIGCGYLFYAPLHGAQYYDFHWLPISIPFVFLLFYGLALSSKRIIIPTTLLLFLIREDIAPGIAVLGFVLLLTGARPKWGAALSVSAALWFTTVKFVIMPAFGTWFFADLYSELMAPGEHGYGSVVKTLLSNPFFVAQRLLTEQKLTYFLHILVPLAFLPLRRPALALLILPGSFFTILTNWPAATSIQFHYSSHWTPYMFGALVVYLGILRRGGQKHPARSLMKRCLPRYRAALGAFAFTLLCHSTVFGFLLKPTSFVGGIMPITYTMTKKEKQRLFDLESLIARIPKNASVTSTDFEAPHLSNRADLFAIGQSRAAGEYLLWDARSFPLARTKANIAFIMSQAPYGLVAEAGGMTLWKRHHDSPETARAWGKLRRQISPRPALQAPPSPQRH